MYFLELSTYKNNSHQWSKRAAPSSPYLATLLRAFSTEFGFRKELVGKTYQLLFQTYR